MLDTAISFKYPNNIVTEVTRAFRDYLLDNRDRESEFRKMNNVELVKLVQPETERVVIERGRVFALWACKF